MDRITTVRALPDEIMSAKFIHYLDMRNKAAI